MMQQNLHRNYCRALDASVRVRAEKPLIIFKEKRHESSQNFHKNY